MYMRKRYEKELNMYIHVCVERIQYIETYISGDLVGLVAHLAFVAFAGYKQTAAAFVKHWFL